MIYLLLGVFVLVWSIFVFLVIKGKRMDGFYFKGLSSFLFVGVFMYGVYHYTKTNNFILNSMQLKFLLLIGLGLVCGLIGDLFLEIQYFYKDNKSRQIAYGMTIFLIGHIFYISALSLDRQFQLLSLVIGLVMAALIYAGGKVMKFQLGQLEIFSYVYSFVIFTMVGQAIFQAHQQAYNIYGLVFMVGAIFFGISDLLLAPIYFKNERRKLFVVGNISTYYLAQILIALSIMFL